MSTDRRGLSSGDVLLTLAVLALAAALAYPRLQRIEMAKRVGATTQAVRALRDGAERFRSERGGWPERAEAGVVPDGLGGYLPGDFTLTAHGCVLGWDRWERVDLPSDTTPPAPEIAEPLPGGNIPALPAADSVVVAPLVVDLGGITARCEDPRVLSALLDTFGIQSSFIRGSAWQIVVPPPGGP